MSRIRILSEHLANQIAAGEVVERPASVIKELVENSIDAGSGSIDIQIEGGGVRLMRVADNGCGMDQDDVLLCIERHATSKLQDESQLGAIATLGFRGEALPSIGSVSRMTILSRTSGAESGTRAELRYGTLHTIQDTGCAQGTIIEVRHLFGNVPARKKFLKSTRTEIFHIEEVIRNLAIANPDVGFTLMLEQRSALDLPARSDLETRVRRIFGYEGPMLSLEHAGSVEQADLQVGGYLLLPESVQSRTARLRILVNGRAVQDRMIRHAVTEGLQGFLMKGFQPAGALLLMIDPTKLDVNVHPAKREIRFRDSNAVHRAVVSVVRSAMEGYQQQSRERLFTSGNHAGQGYQRDRETIGLETAEPKVDPVRSQIEQVRISDLHRNPAPGISGEDQSAPGRSRIRPLRPEPQKVIAETAAGSDEGDGQAEFGGLRLIGQLFSLYLLCEKDEQLVVIDQHAAHERILFGRLRQGYLKKDVPRQKLLFPVTVELGPDHLEVVEKYQESLWDIGFEVEFFGDTTWVIKAVPALMKGIEPIEIFHDVLDALRGGRGGGRDILAGVIDEVFASMACKAAIKAGNRLDPKEMISLLEQMQKSDVFSHCPHGRPVIKEFDRREIEKWFYRHGG